MRDECGTNVDVLHSKNSEKREKESERREGIKEHLKHAQTSYLQGFMHKQNWWNQQGSNLRPGDYESPALTD